MGDDSSAGSSVVADDRRSVDAHTGIVQCARIAIPRHEQKPVRTVSVRTCTDMVVIDAQMRLDAHVLPDTAREEPQEILWVRSTIRI